MTFEATPFLLLFGPTAVAFPKPGIPQAAGNRNMYTCKYKAFILAHGAKTALRGRTFSSAYGGHEDARIAADTTGPALLARVPPCILNNTASIKLVDPARLGDAIKYIEERCRGEDCVVYSAFPGVRSSAFRVVEEA
jgi:hypothetical protein